MLGDKQGSMHQPRIPGWGIPLLMLTAAALFLVMVYATPDDFIAGIPDQIWLILAVFLLIIFMISLMGTNLDIPAMSMLALAFGIIIVFLIAMNTDIFGGFEFEGLGGPSETVTGSTLELGETEEEDLTPNEQATNELAIEVEECPGCTRSDPGIHTWQGNDWQVIPDLQALGWELRSDDVPLTDPSDTMTIWIRRAFSHELAGSVNGVSDRTKTTVDLPITEGSGISEKLILYIKTHEPNPKVYWRLCTYHD